MSNSYFKFKKFTVFQDQCALKVSTEACLFGAIIPKNGKNVLDIGTGTGLLALMYAQKSEAKIKAVEIDENAANKATENFKISDWCNRITLIHTDIISYAKDTIEKFDLIFSNPPFFQNSLISESPEKNVAKHATSLSLFDLVYVVEKLLLEDGKFYVLLPINEVNQLKIILFSRNFYLFEEFLIKTKPEKPYFRAIVGFTKVKITQEIEPKIIEIKQNNIYTEDFKNLLKDYYLDIAFEK